MISSVKKAIDSPLIVGGGIDSVEKASLALTSGADLIVVGNAIEKNPDLLVDISVKIEEINRKRLKKESL